MRQFLTPLALLAISVSTAAAQEQSGRFPVFGPSAEREAFFENQRREEADRVARLEEQRAEARLARQLAAREAEAREEAEPRYRRLVRRCFLTGSQAPETPNEENGSGFGLKPRKSYSETRVVCPRYVFIPAPASETAITITSDNGDLGLRGRFRRPGLSVNVDID